MEAGIAIVAFGDDLAGAFTVFAMGWIAHYGFPLAMRDSIRWMIVGPLYAIAMAGLVMSVVAIIRQRRIWWLGIPGLLLNGLPLLILGILIYRRYR
jgi:hypothetical protein